MGMVLEVAPATGSPKVGSLVELAIELRCPRIIVIPEPAGAVVTPFGDPDIPNFHNDR